LFAFQTRSITYVVNDDVDFTSTDGLSGEAVDSLFGFSHSGVLKDTNHNAKTRQSYVLKPPRHVQLNLPFSGSVHIGVDDSTALTTEVLEVLYMIIQGQSRFAVDVVAITYLPADIGTQSSDGQSNTTASLRSSTFLTRRRADARQTI
jgi:hypothetical protein